MDEYTVTGTVRAHVPHGGHHKVVVWRYKARFLAHDEKEARNAFYRMHRKDEVQQIEIESVKAKPPVFLSEVGEVIHSARV